MNFVGEREYRGLFPPSFPTHTFKALILHSAVDGGSHRMTGIPVGGGSHSMTGIPDVRRQNIQSDIKRLTVSF
jgi:hypothetical protein